MLEVQRRNYASAKANKPTDFLSRNKKATGPNKAEPSKKKGEDGRRLPPKPRPSKPVGSKFETTNQPITSDTVTISKHYLDQLMRMSVVQNDSNAEVKHVEPSQIPGLQNHSHKHTAAAVQDPSLQRVVPNPQPPVVREHQASTRLPSPERVYPKLTTQEQWLSDLSAQAEDQRSKRLLEKEREKQKSPEEYNPWGRPGGGAPIRSESGTIVNAYRKRAKLGQIADTTVEPVAKQQYISHAPPPSTVAKQPRQYGSHDPHAPSLPQVDTSALNSTTTTTDDPYDNSPHYGRGAGPYVDKYVLQEIDQQRQKNLENIAFIKEQIAAKERKKMEAKLAREREEKQEEMKMARERERLDREFQQELVRKRAKEEEATQHMLLLQQRIDQASEQAIAAKFEAKSSKLSPRHNIPGHTTRVVQQSSSSHLLKFDSELRSPSMLQVPVPVEQASQRNSTFRQSKNENAAKKGKSVVSNVRSRPSRIPVLENSPLRNPERKDKRGSSTPLNAHTKKFKGQTLPLREANKVRAVVRNKLRHCDDSRQRSLSPQPQSFSPPVPALAKQLAKHPPAKAARQLVARQPSPPVVARQSSPPVPALAKKLAKHSPAIAARQSSPPVARQPSPPVVARQSSPPVPALAKKLKSTEDLKHSSHPVAKKMMRSPVEPSSDNAELAINRPPSCDPIGTPVSNLPRLPSITTATTQAITSHENMLRQQDPAANRQKTILLELAMLREGIISYTEGIDKRVDRILSKKKCNF